MVKTLKTRLWPWFLLAAALMAGAVVFDGTLGGVTSFSGYMLFLVTCIRGLRQLVRDDPERLEPVVREDGFMGLMAAESLRGRRRQRDPTLATRDDPPKPWP